MDNPEINIFEVALKKALSTTYQEQLIPQLPIKAIDEDLIIYPQYNITDKINKIFKYVYSDEQVFMPVLPQELKGKYLKFFFDYDNNKEEAQSFMLRDNYTVANLVEDLKYDIFVWMASELLFKKPKDYDTLSTAQYFNYNKKPYRSEKWDCTDYGWKLFYQKCILLTDRIQSFPMPLQMIWAYANSKISEEKITNKNKYLNFLTDEKAYDDLDIWDYLNLQNYFNDLINQSVNNIYPNHLKIFTALSDYYLERVFGFKLVEATAKSMLDNLPDAHSLIKYAEILKSDYLFKSKLNILEGMSDFIPLSQAIKLSFPYIAKRTLTEYIDEYNRNYSYSPLQCFESDKYFKLLLGNLSYSFNTSFPEFAIHDYKQITPDELNIYKKLHPRDESELFYYIANPYKCAGYSPSDLLNSVAQQMSFISRY